MGNLFNSDIKSRLLKIAKSLKKGEITDEQASIELKRLYIESDSSLESVDNQLKVLNIEQLLITDPDFDILSPEEKYNFSKELNDIEGFGS